MLTMLSARGRLSLFAGEDNPATTGIFPWGWGMSSYYIGDKIRGAPSLPIWNYHSDQYGRRILLPHWLTVLVTGAFAAAFGIRRPFRFGLRTMLIATTFVAMLLGLIAVAMR
jgi:hypothetical protein